MTTEERVIEILREDGRPFVATAGSDWRLVFNLLRGDEAVNLAGCTVSGSIVRGRGVRAVEVFANIEGEIVAANRVILRVDHDDTGAAGVIAGTYYGDVRVEDADGDVEHFGPYQFEVRRALT